MTNSIIEVNKDFRPLIGEFLMKCHDRNISVKITHTYRSFKEQDKLYSIGRIIDKDKKIVTNALGGWSFHNYGFAFDIAILSKKRNSLIWDTNFDADGDNIPEWDEVGIVADRIECLEWSGNWTSKTFVEKCHFQFIRFQLKELHCNNFLKLLEHIVISPLFDYHIQTILKKMEIYNGRIDGIVGDITKKSMENIGIIYEKNSIDTINGVLLKYFKII